MALVTVHDNFIGQDVLSFLTKQFTPLKDGATRALPQITAPKELETCVQGVLRCRANSIDPKKRHWKPLSMAETSGDLVQMPGRVALGSSPMHRDTGFDASGKPDPHYVEGYVAILYLDGCGTLVVDSGFGEQAFEVKPGRLMVWPNDKCIHRMDCSPGSRARIMIGPMAMNSGGTWQRAGDQYAVWRGDPCVGGPHCPCSSCSQRRRAAPKPAPKPAPKIVQLSGKIEGSEMCVACHSLAGEELESLEVDPKSHLVKDFVGMLDAVLSKPFRALLPDGQDLKQLDGNQSLEYAFGELLWPECFTVQQEWWWLNGGHEMPLNVAQWRLYDADVQEQLSAAFDAMENPVGFLTAIPSSPYQVWRVTSIRVQNKNAPKELYGERLTGGWADLLWSVPPDQQPPSSLLRKGRILADRFCQVHEEDVELFEQSNSWLKDRRGPEWPDPTKPFPRYPRRRVVMLVEGRGLRTPAPLPPPPRETSPPLDMDKEICELFHSFDMDGNGVLSRDELQELFTSLDMTASEDDWAKLFKTLDADGLGVIEIDALVNYAMSSPSFFGDSVD